MDMSDEADKQLKERLRVMRESGIMTNYVLPMARVPKQTVIDFKNLAKGSCGDYGLTFKMLVDYYKESHRRDIVYDGVNRRINVLEHLVGKSLMGENKEKEKPKETNVSRQGVQIVKQEEKGDGKDE